LGRAARRILGIPEFREIGRGRFFGIPGIPEF